MTNFEIFLNSKLIESIIFKNDCNSILKEYDSVILNREFIISLDLYVKEYVKTNMLEKAELDNLLSLIFYIRINFDGNKKIYYPIYNDMVIAINNSNGKNYMKYLKQNVLGRFPYLLSYEKFLSMKETIKNSIQKDYFYILCTVDFSDDEFKAISNELVLNPYYMMSINQFLYENKDYNDITFFKRVGSICKKSKLRIDEVKDKNQKKLILESLNNYKF